VTKGVNQPFAALERIMEPKGAVASVALSHPEDCDCTVCRASRGDEDAWKTLLVELSERDRH